MKKFLKRFEKLEHKPPASLIPGSKATITKRFECLEINDKKIEIAIADQAAKGESAPAGTNYFRMCPYCGAENKAEARECGKCRHTLTEYGSDYGGQEHLVKKCACGAVNLKERKFCWVCGRDFSLWGDEEVVKKQQNIIVLTINDQTYRSNDPNLPPGIVALMEKIRRQGYSKELINEWIRQTNDEKELRQEEVKQNIQRIRYDLLWQVGGVILFLLLIAFRIMGGFRR